MMSAITEPVEASDERPDDVALLEESAGGGRATGA